jgi:hypothetical protein
LKEHGVLMAYGFTPSVEVAGMKDKIRLRNKRHQNKRILSSSHRFLFLTALVIDIQAKFKYN